MLLDIKNVYIKKDDNGEIISTLESSPDTWKKTVHKDDYYVLVPHCDAGCELDYNVIYVTAKDLQIILKKNMNLNTVIFSESFIRAAVEYVCNKYNKNCIDISSDESKSTIVIIDR